MQPCAADMDQLSVIWHDMQQLVAASEGSLAGAGLGGLSAILTSATLNRFSHLSLLRRIAHCLAFCSRQDTVSLALGTSTGSSSSSTAEAVRLPASSSSAFGAAKFAADAAAAAAAEAAAKQSKGPAGSFYA